MTVTINGTNGVTTPEVVLDNSAADGAQVVLKSSGYSDWNLDNYSGRLRAYYGATEYLTVTSSGNVGIGTSSPAVRVHAMSAASSVSFALSPSSSNTNVGYITNDSTYLLFGSGYGSTGQKFRVALQAPDNAATIDSSGNLLVGATSVVSNERLYVNGNAGAANNLVRFTNTQTSGTIYGLYVNYSAYSPNAAGNDFIGCSDSTTSRVRMYSNGGIANFSANNVNLSDAREKKDVELAGNYLDKICAIPVKTFLYNDQTDTDKNLGVIAQDVQAIAPELVAEGDWGTAEEPKTRLSIYQTDLQYALMKCIQEQQAIINAQQAALTALTARVTALDTRLTSLEGTQP